MLQRTPPALPRARLNVPTPQRAKWGWAVLGAMLGLTAALVLFAPARWAGAAIAQASGGRLLLEAARGTVWNGSAQLVLSGGAGSSDAAALPSRLDWALRPRLNGLSLRLHAPCCTPQPVALHAQPRWGGMSLQVDDGGTTQWPAGLLAGLGTPWNTLRFDGALQLVTRGLRIEWVAGQLRLAGGAELSALGLSSRLSTLRPLGSYRLTLTGGDVPGLQLSTLEGGLQLSGNGQWVGSRLRFAGEARAAPDREAVLANLLNIIGRREGARSVITIG